MTCGITEAVEVAYSEHNSLCVIKLECLKVESLSGKDRLKLRRSPPGKQQLLENFTQCSGVHRCMPNLNVLSNLCHVAAESRICYARHLFVFGAVTCIHERSVSSHLTSLFKHFIKCFQKVCVLHIRAFALYKL